MLLRRRGRAGFAVVSAAVLGPVLSVLPASPVGGAVAAPVARAAVASVADLRLRPTQAVTGEAVDLRATVSPAVSRPVVLQRRAGDRWVEVTRGRTDAAGVAVFVRAAPRAATTYRVWAPRADRSGTSYAADGSPGRLLTVQRQVVLLRMSDAATVGEAVWAFVECSPHRPGRPVVLRERFEGGAWRTVATGVQNARGMVQLDVTVAEVGDYEHRAVTQVDEGAVAARSVVHDLTVTGP